MKKRFAFIFAALLVCAFSYAGPVDLEVARGKAARFLKDLNGGTILATGQAEYAPARSVKGKVITGDMPAYYVFNAEDGNGYVIVSGEDNTEDILGYSATGSFDMESMPENVKAWLLGYAEQIAMMEDYVVQKRSSSMQYNSEWTAVAPMLTTQWNQGAPYNNECPMDKGNRSVTGCSATAMAQIMKYHEWPQDSVAGISGYVMESSKTTLTALPATIFRWNEMRNYYDVKEKGDAVAELMRYCGQAIKSEYSSGATGAYTADVAYAFQETFDYSQNIEMQSIYHHALSEWEGIIYNELKDARPVYHAGYSMEGGHAFVCDGYDGNGMFHFNWGWGGAYDGYFRLALMNPESGGIGSGSSDGYSAGQEIIIGIQPSAGAERKTRYFVPFSEQIVGTTLFSFFYNPYIEKMTANVGFAIIDENNEIKTVIKNCGAMTLEGTYRQYEYAGVDMDSERHSLAKGTYRIATVCRPRTSSIWKRVGSYQNFFTVEIDARHNIVSMKQSPSYALALVDWKPIGNLVAGATQSVQVTLENKGDEINTMLYLFVGDANATAGASQSRTAILMKKGEVSDYLLTFTPDTAGVYNLWVSDKEDGSPLAHMKVTVKEAPKKASNLTLQSCVVDEDECSVTVKVRNNSTEPYYRSIMAYLFEDLYGTGTYYSTKGIELPGDIDPRTVKTFKFKFEDAESYTQYAIGIYYYATHMATDITALGDAVWFVTGDTPVESIEASTETAKPRLIYRLDGTRVTDIRQGGVYIIDGKKTVR